MVNGRSSTISYSSIAIVWFSLKFGPCRRGIAISLKKLYNQNTTPTFLTTTVLFSILVKGYRIRPNRNCCNQNSPPRRSRRFATNTSTGSMTISVLRSKKIVKWKVSLCDIRITNAHGRKQLFVALFFHSKHSFCPFIVNFAKC